MAYQHLSLEERERIALLRFNGASLAELARELGRDKSTLSRELHRNGTGGMYLAYQAQTRAERRRREAPRPHRLAYRPLREYCEAQLREYWSPEQIAGRLEVDFPDEPRMRASHETLYRHVREDRACGGRLYTFLRLGRKRRRKRYGRKELRGQIPGRVGIEKRPAVVARRARFGDWESDTLRGSGPGDGLATHVERKSRYLRLARPADSTAASFTRATVKALGPLPAALRKTMTVDNGKEFAGFRRLEARLGLRVYFARPYHAWERGLCENTNGLLRQFFPKGLELRRVSRGTLDRVEAWLNNRPRKRLGYRTPLEVLRRSRAVALQT